MTKTSDESVDRFLRRMAFLFNAQDSKIDMSSSTFRNEFGFKIDSIDLNSPDYRRNL
jgi:hypothetical protein